MSTAAQPLAGQAPPPQFDLSTAAKDPDFLNAPVHEKIAFLSAHDQDFAKAHPNDQAAYLNHVLGNDQPTQFEKDRAGATPTLTGGSSKTGGGILSNFWDVVKNVFTTPPSSVSPYPGMDLDAKQNIAQQSAQADAARKEVGRSPVYRAAAGVAAPFANFPAQEAAADVGNKRAIVGQALGSSAVAATPLTGEGVAKVAKPITSAVKEGAVASRDAVGTALRTETGSLKPGVKAAAALGKLVGIPEVADYLIPGRPDAATMMERRAVPITKGPNYIQNKERIAADTENRVRTVQQAKEARKIVAPAEAAPLRRVDSEGRPATWTGEDVNRLASEGNRNAITQKVLRGKELAPNERYVMGDPSMSNLEYSPREVTRFAPDGTPIRQGGKVSPVAQPFNAKQPALLPESVPQGNPTPFAGPERRTSSQYERDIFQKMLNNPEGEKLGQSMRQAREGSVGAESEGPARLAIMRSPDYPKFRAAELSGDTATMREMLIKAKSSLPQPAKPITH